MLTQDKVDRILTLLKKTTLSNQEIARTVGVGSTTVGNIRNGRRHSIGRLENGEVTRRLSSEKHEVFVCPKCGPVEGAYCIYCYGKELRSLNLELGIDDSYEGPGPVPGDPPPEVIEQRAAALRKIRELDMLEHESDPDTLLWVDFDRPIFEERYI